MVMEGKYTVVLILKRLARAVGKGHALILLHILNGLVTKTIRTVTAIVIPNYTHRLTDISTQ
jgi:hypothetical protein